MEVVDLNDENEIMRIIQKDFFQDAKENFVLKNENDQRNTENKNVAYYVTKERTQLNKIQTNQRYDMRTFLR